MADPSTGVLSRLDHYVIAILQGSIANNGGNYYPDDVVVDAGRMIAAVDKVQAPVKPEVTVDPDGVSSPILLEDILNKFDYIQKRCLNNLHVAGIYYVHELDQKTKRWLLRRHDFGCKQMRALSLALHKAGISTTHGLEKYFTTNGRENGVENHE